MEQRISVQEAKVNEILRESGAPFSARFTDAGGRPGYELVPEGEKTRELKVAAVAHDGNITELPEEEIVKSLYDAYYSFDLFSGSVEKLKDREDVLQNIFPMLSSKDKKEKLEKRGILTDSFLDMTVSFYIPLEGDSEKQFTAPLTKDVAEKHGITLKEAYSASVANIERELSYMSMTEVVCSMTGMDPEETGIAGSPMMVLTKKDKSRGAALILSENVRKKLLRSSESGKVIVLPSSIHECIVLNDSDSFTGEELKSMVMDVNENEVSDEDKLSDSVYIVDGEGMRIYA